MRLLGAAIRVPAHGQGQLALQRTRVRIILTQEAPRQSLGRIKGIRIHRVTSNGDVAWHFVQADAIHIRTGMLRRVLIKHRQRGLRFGALSRAVADGAYR